MHKYCHVYMHALWHEFNFVSVNNYYYCDLCAVAASFMAV